MNGKAGKGKGRRRLGEKRDEEGFNFIRDEGPIIKGGGGYKGRRRGRRAPCTGALSYR